MRVIVCGGRNYNDAQRVNDVLDKLHAEAGIDHLAEGGANGADRLASDWAKRAGVPTQRFAADWEAHGTFAGPMRNAYMLEESAPDIVIAFPGSRGTADMIKKARRAGVKVIEIAP